MSSSAIILFPLAGCAAEGELTQEQSDLLMRQHRETVRKRYSDEGLKSFIAMAEILAARLQKRAIDPAGTEHERGQAYGVGQILALVRGILSTAEEDAEEKPKGRRR